MNASSVHCACQLKFVKPGMVDTIFADVAQPDQARIVAINAHHFLKNGGHFVISIKANCIDSTAEPEAVFAGEVEKLKQERLKPQEQITLEPYERDHAVVVGMYRSNLSLFVSSSLPPPDVTNVRTPSVRFRMVPGNRDSVETPTLASVDIYAARSA
ncbi:hypothetical protein HPB51_011755 [Rhipicephalus microplus]|uniref:rRNA 2'-O-methyltransferase fibrillarin n=1 Tax=Rhipicephalus microplus TaxID=6941 RepID=A0A9J6DN29_RHIMP|nr:hypothetical protein HPB51_011755 [Rhipicephalus microplus]